MEYRKRIVDEILELKMKAFGAIWITGPKGCGKTTSGKQKLSLNFRMKKTGKTCCLLLKHLQKNSLSAKNQFYLMNGRMLQNFLAQLEKMSTIPEKKVNIF